MVAAIGVAVCLLAIVFGGSAHAAEMYGERVIGGEANQAEGGIPGGQAVIPYDFQLSSMALAPDGNSLYFIGYGVLKRLDLTTHEVTRVDDPNHPLSDPTDIAIAPSGRLYVADGGAHAIRVKEPNSDQITRRVGPYFQDATGSLKRFESPRAVTVAPDGKLYFADAAHLFVWDPASNRLSSIANVGGAAELHNIGKLAATAGGVYIADRATNKLYFWSTSTEQLSHVAGTGQTAVQNGGGAITDPHQVNLNFGGFRTTALTVSPNDHYLYVSDINMLRRLDTRTGQFTDFNMRHSSGVYARNPVAAMIVTRGGYLTARNGLLYYDAQPDDDLVSPQACSLLGRLAGLWAEADNAWAANDQAALDRIQSEFQQLAQPRTRTDWNAVHELWRSRPRSSPPNSYLQVLPRELVAELRQFTNYVEAQEPLLGLRAAQSLAVFREWVDRKRAEQARQAAVTQAANARRPTGHTRYTVGNQVFDLYGNSIKVTTMGDGSVVAVVDGRTTVLVPPRSTPSVTPPAKPAPTKKPAPKPVAKPATPAKKPAAKPPVKPAPKPNGKAKPKSPAPAKQSPPIKNVRLVHNVIKFGSMQGTNVRFSVLKPQRIKIVVRNKKGKVVLHVPPALRKPGSRQIFFRMFNLVTTPRIGAYLKPLPRGIYQVEIIPVDAKGKQSSKPVKRQLRVR